MKKSIEERYGTSLVSEEDKERYKKKVIILKSILEGFFLFMIIFSWVRLKRIMSFYNVLGGGNIVSFYGFAIILFYIALYVFFIYNTGILVYLIYKMKKQEDWLGTIHRMNQKMDIPAFILKCISILLFIMIYVTTPCSVSGSSMETTFQSGDKVMCSDWFYTPSKGDVIVIDAVGFYDSDYDDDSFYIKRIAGLPGSKIERVQEIDLNGDVVFHTLIDGEQCDDISEADFQNILNSIGVTGSALSCIIPEGRYLVLGDNRAPGASKDSRAFGLIYEKQIFGKVYMRLFPLNKIAFDLQRRG